MWVLFDFHSRGRGKVGSASVECHFQLEAPEVFAGRRPFYKVEWRFLLVALYEVHDELLR